MVRAHVVLERKHSILVTAFAKGNRVTCPAPCEPTHGGCLYLMDLFSGRGVHQCACGITVHGRLMIGTSCMQ
ncbi:hypothetical protein PAHAL_4G093800 [Panicum hallii]|uniref:Uncharacterized protein n=1 Tax=Panicum hallii TaxID=206008 RepID=A0A2T8JCD1_9POAL|nr:hypothetical protein PAHAL_4G093800 [Panicum hallii]